MNKQTICILGGTGFVGHYLTHALVNAGYHVRIPSRRRERNRELLVMPGVDVVEGSISDPAFLNQIIEKSDVVINLVALLNEGKKGDFQKIHVDLPKRINDVMAKHGVKRLLHMSALNADATAGPSRYLKSKGEGEDIAHSAEKNNNVSVTSFRPSVIFGSGDHFFNMFALLLKRSILALPLACPNARFAPIYAEDVTSHMVAALVNDDSAGKRYDLCGPHVYTLEQLVEYTNKLIGTNKALIGLGDGASRFMGSVLQFAPGKPFTPDNYLSMKKDSVCPISKDEQQQRTSLEAVVPLYLGGTKQKDHYDNYRYYARRETQ
ncbi:NAD-dependent epimerase/dehydratase [hydrothermal vent metagenome]|uniref:NAD-dependent epimerase/dehydratase n=1 Tax=hydrothermal vent metagenome TaxID=652676 RepID=A0A3B0ZK97_9ZZZZ